MIIFLNGSINSGKTTIANMLAENISNTALLEIDTLRQMINWVPIDQAVSINIENAISLIKNFSNKKYNIIVPYPLSKKNYDYIINQLKDIDTKIYTFTFSPKLDKVITNRGSRELDNNEVERIKYHYDIGIHNPIFGEIIDNTEQTPEETTNYILRKIS